ncbi:MAG: hypothetical protein Phog2KO_26640 [Phototrophicaceae bacterium]
MNFEQIKKVVKDGYESNGFDVVDEQENGETIIRYPHSETYDVTLKISQADIQEYGKLHTSRGEFVQIGTTGYANKNFRESLLISLDPSIDSRDIDDLFFKKDQDSDTYVEIDTISPIFANFFRFEAGYMNLCIDRLYAMPSRYRKASSTNPIEARRIFATPLSVRVYNINAESTAEAIRISDELIEGALFTLSYELGIPLMLATEYPTSRFEHLQKVKDNNHKMLDMILPDSSFRHDLVRYYQAGIATPIAIQQFLSFYQILELFFQDVNHVGVYDDLYHLFRSDDFKPDNSTLARIVSMVEANKRDLTTTDLLEQLIRQYIDSDDIKQFIVNHSGQAEETIHTLAKRIVTARDAIMNAGINGLPPSDSSIAKDVPLVKFLAEQVILATRS